MKIGHWNNDSWKRSKSNAYSIYVRRFTEEKFYYTVYNLRIPQFTEVKPLTMATSNNINTARSNQYPMSPFTGEEHSAEFFFHCALMSIFFGFGGQYLIFLLHYEKHITYNFASSLAVVSNDGCGNGEVDVVSPLTEENSS
ncbi:hypothetical protein PGB90_002199 [Kerria lacca]